MAENLADGEAERREHSTESRRVEDDSAFATLTGDFYRGEIERTAAWRQRLDQTTNWAVVVVAAILTWAFSSGDNPHYVILIGMFGVAAFLAMEATRYREYDIWRGRVRTLQERVYADMYDPSNAGDTTWRAQLGRDLRDPEFNMSFLAALGHRLRRSYLPLLFLLFAAWVARITVFKTNEPWQQSAAILMIPGDVVVGVVAAFYAVLVVLAVWSARDERVREFQE